MNSVKIILAIEASILKKRIFSIDLNNQRRIFPNKFGIILKKKSNIKKFLSKKKYSNKNTLNKRKLFFRILNSNKKYSSVKIISEKIDQLYKNEIELSFFKVLFFSILFKIYDFFKSYFKIDKKIDKIMNKKLSGGISKKEIFKYIKILDKNSKFMVMQVAKNTFFIKKLKL